MDKIYEPKKVEEKIYHKWEKGGYFKPEINPNGEPYTIILPPPNANGDLHFGHAMFVIEDILIRFKRMQGFSTLWLPGTDHAGIETQFVFEKHLAKEGKSRFDFNRVDLYQQIWEYVRKNKGGIENQLRRLGFSLDWSREKFTLEADIVKLVADTFKKMYQEGLIYRDYRLVNYCTKDGTSFSDYEVLSEEKEGVLYYIKYPLSEGTDALMIATTRPETLYGDVAVMVHPEDPRYKKFIGKKVLLPLTNREIPVIADEYVDQNFGTGAVKVTPAHDFNDFEVGRRHNLTFPPIIGWNGKFEKTGVVDGLYAKQAREVTIQKLQEENLLIEKKPHKMVIKICYKCKTILEPLPLEQWYVKVESLKKKAIEVVQKGEIKIFPRMFEAPYIQWLEGLHDWNISRQNVWGIQIPVYYEVEKETDFAVAFIDKKGTYQQDMLDELLKDFSFEEITAGLQRVIARMEAKVVFPEAREKGKKYLPETDTFDTWFSSGQWPYVTLKTSKNGDFEKFYPTSVLETANDILKAWVSRMVMLGIYITGNVPFKDVLFHGLVTDPYGKKMSKSKGNVVNPLDIADQYGADAVRFALVYNNATGSEQSLSYPKLEASRKFTNKLWNMARFIEMKKIHKISDSMHKLEELKKIEKNEEDKKWIKKVEELSSEVTKYIESYQFNLASERLYEFIWHEFADKYIEDVKNRMDENSSIILTSLYITLIKLLHPFMPFVTEEIFEVLTKSKKPLIIQSWPR